MKRIFAFATAWVFIHCADPEATTEEAEGVSETPQQVSSVAQPTTEPDPQDPTLPSFGAYAWADCSADDADSDDADLWPALLSETNCFEDVAAHRFVDGVLAYNVVFPFWSDTALKERAIVLPADTSLTYEDDGTWGVPVGGFIFKTFFRFGVPFETRIIKNTNSGWKGASYQWNEARSDADHLTASATANIEGLEWTYPSPSDCDSCHNNPTGYPLSLNTYGMNTDFDIGRVGHPFNQIETLSAMGLLDDAPESLDSVATLTDPNDETASLTARARSYLHMNCSFCHQPSGDAGNDTNFLLDKSWSTAGICDHVPDYDMGNADARVLVPGDLDNSLIYLRLKETGGDRMPPIGSGYVDDRSIRLIEEWINSVADCDDVSD